MGTSGDERGSGTQRASHLLSRRQMVGRVGKGALAAGMVAWVAPEVLIATPTAADALSAPPDCRTQGGTCSGNAGNTGTGNTGTGTGNTGGAGGTGNTGNGNTGGAGGTGNTGASEPTSPSTGTSGGAGGSGGSGGTSGTGTGGAGSSLVNPNQPVVAATGSTSPGGVAPATASGGGLPFTGLDLVRDAEVGGAMVLGGWALTRWSSRRAATAGDGSSTGQPAPGADEEP